jgi:heparanase
MQKNQWYVLTIILACLTFGVNGQSSLHLKDLKIVGKVDERYQSFNVEMCEVIGGDFWIPYNLIDSVRKTYSTQLFLRADNERFVVVSI